MGQLQLISFARVILEQRPLVLLDEATSALDSQSEKDLLHVLKVKLPHSTIISVAVSFSINRRYINLKNKEAIPPKYHHDMNEDYGNIQSIY